MDKKDLQKLKKSTIKADPLLLKLREKYSEKELKALANNSNLRMVPGMSKVPVVNFNGESIKFAFITDLHLGSIFAIPEIIKDSFKIFKKENCNFICIAGDVTEGWSNRPGHIHELTHIGYESQKKHAIEVLSHWDSDMFMIDGNHDRWYIKSNGALIVKDICENLPHAHFLGHDQGTINLDGKANIMLWHGEDGSSYATSYRIQKVVEAFTGGEKPNILLAGHVHKQGYFMERHVHSVIGGAMCQRSSWMKSKRLANHSGFWIIEAAINDSGVSRFKSEWFPLYL